MLNSFDPFNMLVGFIAMLCGLTVLVVCVVLFESGVLHWFILGAIACYYLGKFIRERTGI
jgi:hypothetical protein